MTELDGDTIRWMAKVHVEQGAAVELRRLADSYDMSANALRLMDLDDETERETAITVFERLAQELRERADEITGGRTALYRDALVAAGMSRNAAAKHAGP